MLISVHLPKTAGSSFSAALGEKLGSSLLLDYGDQPINTPSHERNTGAFRKSIENFDNSSRFKGIKCIHGHFLPIKYLLLSDKLDIQFITWMRNPVERLLSHYYFWKRTFNSETAPPLHRKFMEEKWSIERFCLGPELKNLYYQFLYGFPLEYFALIGITESYEEDLSYFSSRFLGYHVEMKRLNVGKTTNHSYEIPERLRNKIAHFHSKDMELYERALDMKRMRSAI